MTARHLIVVEPFERLGRAFVRGDRIAEADLVAAIAAGDHGRHVVAVAAPEPGAGACACPPPPEAAVGV